MKKVFDFLFAIVSMILLIMSIATFVMAFSGSKSEESINLSICFSCIICIVILIGLSIIVDAASIYIEKNKKQQEVESE